MRSPLGKAVRARFSRRMKELLPELVERPASDPATKGLGGRLYAWRANDHLTCFVGLQIALRDDAFYLNLAWGPGPDYPLSADVIDPNAIGTESAQLRLGALHVPQRADQWWLFEPPDFMDGAWLEKIMDPPPIESLLPRVEGLVESAIARLVDDAIPLFGRVARARGVEPPARWSTLADSVVAPATNESGWHVTLRAEAQPAPAVRELSTLPIVEAPPDPASTQEDEILAPALAYIEGVRARLAPSPMRDALDVVGPRCRDLVVAASAITVPHQRAIEAKLTSAQRRMLDRLAPKDGIYRVDRDEHLDSLREPAALFRVAVQQMQLIASYLRTIRRYLADARREELGKLVTIAEAYVDALVARQS